MCGGGGGGGLKALVPTLHITTASKWRDNKFIDFTRERGNDHTERQRDMHLVQD